MKKILFLLVMMFLISFVSAEVDLISPADLTNTTTNPETFIARSNLTTGLPTANISLYTNISGVWEATNTTSYFNPFYYEPQISQSPAGLTFKRNYTFNDTAQTILNISLNGWNDVTANPSNIFFKYYYNDSTAAWSNQTTNTTVFRYNMSNPEPAKFARWIEFYMQRGASSGSVRANETQIYASFDEYKKDVNWTLTIPLGMTNWNVEQCDINNNCEFSSANRTINTHLLFSNESFLSSSTEGNIQYFELNASVTQELTSATLWYNQIPYTGTITQFNSTWYTLSRTLVTPSVPADGTRYFHWSVNNRLGEQYNATNNSQTVINIGMDDCSVNPLLLVNYSLFDEENGTILSVGNESIQVLVELWDTDLSQQITNFSQVYSQNNAPVCLSAGTLDTSTFAMFSTVKYSAQDYAVESYHIQNYTLSNTTNALNITLYDLKSSDSTAFQITYKNSNFLAVGGALIQINRQYPGEGVFKTVEIPITDNNGQTVAHLVKDDALYNFIITQNGSVLATFNNLKAFCEDSLSQSCFITLNEIGSNAIAYTYDETLGITYNLDYNTTSRLLSLTFVSVDGATKNVTYIARKLDNLGNNTACSATLVSSSGTLSCTVPPSLGNSTLEVEIFVDGQSKTFEYIRGANPINLGSGGYFLAFFLILTLVMMTLSSKTAVVLSSLFGFVVSAMVFLFDGGIVASGSAIMWLAIGVIILVYKLNKDKIT